MSMIFVNFLSACLTSVDSTQVLKLFNLSFLSPSLSLPSYTCLVSKEPSNSRVMSEKEILSSTAPGAEEVQGLPVANASALDAGADAEEGGDGDSAVNAGAENDADAEGEEDVGAHTAGEDGKIEEDTNMDETDEERKQRACRQSMFIFNFSWVSSFLFSSSRWLCALYCSLLSRYLY